MWISTSNLLTSVLPSSFAHSSFYSFSILTSPPFFLFFPLLFTPPRSSGLLIPSINLSILLQPLCRGLNFSSRWMRVYVFCTDLFADPLSLILLNVKNFKMHYLPVNLFCFEITAANDTNIPEFWWTWVMKF